MNASGIPSAIGEFEIVRPLGAGGMGSVYVALQRSTQKQRALKLMHAELATNEDLRRRFVQEARIGALIESPHVVEVIDAGIDPASGAPWLAMELLEGRELADLLAGGRPLDRATAQTVFYQLAHALGAAHRKGIVHRDLKPENIFLATPRTGGTTTMVKVLDFGIAKMTTEARATTAAVGTPLWMAPEQTHSAQVTPRTDVWALGLIAFHALTGKIYWRSANEGGGAIAVLREIVQSPLAAASERAAALGAAPLPLGFDAWFARCVNREPAQRFEDAAAAYAALAPILASTEVAPLGPVGAAPPRTASLPMMQAFAPAATPPPSPAPAPLPAMIPAAAPDAATDPSFGRRRRVLVMSILSAIVVGIAAVIGWLALSPPHKLAVELAVDQRVDDLDVRVKTDPGATVTLKVVGGAQLGSTKADAGGAASFAVPYTKLPRLEESLEVVAELGGKKARAVMAEVARPPSASEVRRRLEDLNEKKNGIKAQLSGVLLEREESVVLDDGKISLSWLWPKGTKIDIGDAHLTSDGPSVDWSLDVLGRIRAEPWSTALFSIKLPVSVQTPGTAPVTGTWEIAVARSDIWSFLLSDAPAPRIFEGTTEKPRLVLIGYRDAPLGTGTRLDEIDAVAKLTPGTKRRVGICGNYRSSQGYDTTVEKLSQDERVIVYAIRTREKLAERLISPGGSPPCPTSLSSSEYVYGPTQEEVDAALKGVVR